MGHKGARMALEAPSPGVEGGSSDSGTKTPPGPFFRLACGVLTAAAGAGAGAGAGATEGRNPSRLALNPLARLSRKPKNNPYGTWLGVSCPRLTGVYLNGTTSSNRRCCR